MLTVLAVLRRKRGADLRRRLVECRAAPSVPHDILCLIAFNVFTVFTVSKTLDLDNLRFEGGRGLRRRKHWTTSN